MNLTCHLPSMRVVCLEMARQGKGLVENQKKMPSFKMQSSRHVQTTNGENHFFFFFTSFIYGLSYKIRSV